MNAPSSPRGVAVARHAMGTRFEILLQGGEEGRLRAAGEEALEEIERLDQQLSLYRATSEVNHINTRAHHEAVRVSPAVFGLLEKACELAQATGGAFDITVGPLIRCWGFMRESGRLPSPEEITEAREQVGAGRLLLDKASRTVRFARQGMMIDLGAIGKGYALDRAAEILADLGVRHALLHGGTSTVYGLGTDAAGGAWKIAVDPPEAAETVTNGPLAVLELQDSALSVSAVWGKGFERDGTFYGHVIDPRRGAPTQAAALAAVALPTGLESDALSTALLIIGSEGFGPLRARSGFRGVVASFEGGALRVEKVNF